MMAVGLRLKLAALGGDRTVVKVALVAFAVAEAAGRASAEVVAALAPD